MSTYHHGKLRPALMLAAGETLEKEGVAALSLRDAARRAGVSHNAPYRHFADRDALLAALAAEGFHMLGEAMRGEPGKQMGEAYVRFALAQPERFRLMFGARRQAAQETYATLLSAFRKDGAIADPDKAAAAAWSLVHGLAQLILDGQFKNEPGFIAKVIGAVRFAQRSA